MKKKTKVADTIGCSLVLVRHQRLLAERDLEIYSCVCGYCVCDSQSVTELVRYCELYFVNDLRVCAWERLKSALNVHMDCECMNLDIFFLRVQWRMSLDSLVEGVRWSICLRALEWITIFIIYAEFLILFYNVCMHHEAEAFCWLKQHTCAFWLWTNVLEMNGQLRILYVADACFPHVCKKSFWIFSTRSCSNFVHLLS